MVQSATIIAVDPSLCMSGIAFFVDGNLEMTGRIKTRRPKEGFKDDRLEQIAMSFRNNLLNCNGKDTVLAIETQYLFGSFGNAILKVAEVTGVLKGVYLDWAFNQLKHRTTYGILDIAPSEAKKAVGMRKKLKRKESKIAVMECVNKLYPGWKITSSDIADAVAIGHAALNKIKS